MDRRERFRRADRAARRAAAPAEDALAALYRSELRGVYLDAARRLTHRKTHVAAAADPGWALPDPEELVPPTLPAVLEARRNHRARVRVVERFVGDVASALELSWDVTSPLAEGVAARAGQRIVTVAGTVRRDVMAVVAAAREQGASIPDAAAAIRTQAGQLTDSMARRIARTELLGLVNGSSVASARLAEMEWKQWLATSDERTRDEHAEADGQVVPVAAPFVVGGAELMFPGDQSSAPGDMVVNCRCTVVYPDGPEGLTAGGAMPDRKPGRLRMRARPRTAAAPAAVESVGAPWRALSVPEGVWTSDGRMIEVGATDWRELPLTLMAQFSTDEGHDGAVVAGRIDAYERNQASEVWSSGVFDAGENGSEAERLVREQHLRGVSVDLADMDVEVEWIGADGEPVEVDPDTGEPVDPDAEIVDMRLRATRAVIMGQTITPFPAFAESRIELADAAVVAAAGGAAILEMLDADGAVVASAQQWTSGRARLHLPLIVAAAEPVTEFSGSMVAVFPLPDEAAALAVGDGGQPAEELHSTLAYVPGDVAPDHATLVAAVEDAAASSGVISGQVTGVGLFAPGEDGVPLVALVDALGLNALRTRVAESLAEAGVAYSTDHDFMPHVTLAYQDEGDLSAAGDATGRPLSFLTLSVVSGDGQRTDLELAAAASGSGRGEAPPPQRPPAPATEAATDPVRHAAVRVPTADELAQLTAAVDAGFMTRNEARQALGLDAEPGADVLAGVDPEVAIVAAALDTVARVASAPVNVAAPDLSVIGEALHQVAAAVAVGNEQVRQAIAASSGGREPVVVFPPGQEPRGFDYLRDDEGRVTGLRPSENGRG